MSGIVPSEIIERIHASGRQLVLSITGGGSRAIAELLEVGGASATVLEAVVPYAAAALDRWLGGPAEHYCTEHTARAMAMAAFERARQLSAADPLLLVGIGTTASLATTRSKRGPHRVHVAWQSAERTVALSCELAKGQRTRAAEEAIAGQLILWAVAEACRVDAVPLLEPTVAGAVRRREKHAPPAWTEVLLGRRSSVIVCDEQSRTVQQTSSTAAAGPPAVLFPGAFNPLHEGHRRMAQIAAAHCGRPVTFELSIANVDKPPLDFLEVADRLTQFAGNCVLLTHAATFEQKAQANPGCTFVVGADTVLRIADPRYYGDEPRRRDASIATIASQGCRFLVFGRMIAGHFQSLADLALPQALRELCDEVPEADFRIDLSSTELRTA